MESLLPANDNVDPDQPLRLSDAVKYGFPHGGMTVSGLRREAAKGRLVVEKIANKDFTTLRAIQEMRNQCRVKVEVHVSGGVPNAARAQSLSRKERGLLSTVASISPRRARFTPDGSFAGIGPALRASRRRTQRQRRAQRAARPDIDDQLDEWPFGNIEHFEIDHPRLIGALPRSSEEVRCGRPIYFYSRSLLFRVGSGNGVWSPTSGPASKSVPRSPSTERISASLMSSCALTN